MVIAGLEQRGIREWISLEELRVDAIYQRNPPSPATIRYMAQQWDDNKANVIVVSLRPDGFYYVLDGQRRVAAARLAHGNSYHIRALVLFNLTVAEEAALFAVYNTERLRASLIDVFKARLVAQDPTALAIRDITRQAGFTIGLSGGALPRMIQAVGALEGVYHMGGHPLLSRTLFLLAAAFDSDAKRMTSWALGGMATFLRRYGERCDDGRVITVIKRAGADGMVAGMKALASTPIMSGSGGGRTAWTAWGRYLTIIYNRGLRTSQLPDWDSVK